MLRLKLAILLALLPLTACAQTIRGGIKGKGGIGTPPTIPIILPAYAILPQVWADPHECPTSGATYDVVKHIPGDYTAANAQQANVDWAAAADQSWHIIVAHNQVIAPLTFLPKAVGAGLPTKCIVFDSDTPLTAGRVVCSHGIQDNLSTSTDIGIRNPDCSGTGMSYQLGATVTSISPGAFTLADGTNTNTSAYNDLASMYTIECNTTNCSAVQTDGTVDANGNAANHFAVYNAEMRVNSTKACCFPAQIFYSGATLASIPSHYHFDRVWSHGDATDAGAGVNALTDGIRVNCGGNCSVTNSQFSKLIRPGSEGHLIYWNAATQLMLDHNWGEGMSIAVFDGGISNAVITGPSGVDIQITRNRWTYPWAWLGHGSGAGSVCGAGVSCVKKNAGEMKGCLRCLLDGNIYENVDNSGAQNGRIFGLNVRACTPSVCDNYAQTIAQITVTNNIMRHGCRGIEHDPGSGNAGGSGNSAATPARNLAFINDLIYDISLVNPGCVGAAAGGTFELNGSNHDFAITSVTRDPTGTFSTIQLTGGTGENQTGLANGDPIWLTGCTDTSFNSATGPPFTTAITVAGDTITYGNPGTANATTTCTDFSNGFGWPNFLLIQHLTAVGDVSMVGPGSSLTAPNAVFPRHQTYRDSIFAGSGGFSTPGQVDGTNFSSGWFDTSTLTIHHMVWADRVADVWTSGTVIKLGKIITPTGSPVKFYTAVTNGTTGGSQPAFPSGQRSCVTDNTVVWQEIGSRVGTSGGLPLYTEYVTAGTPHTPPSTMFFPMTDFTYGSSATSASIGFIGALNAPTTGTNACVGGTQTAGYNIAQDIADWHGYALDSSSSFKNAASDGTDIGISTTAIDSAQTATPYVCQSACGAGPKIN